jgi:bacterioferritin
MATQKTPFLSDISAIRKRARQHIESGAVTPSYSLDRDTAVKILNEALATEIVCTLRYRRHYFTTKGILGEAAKAEFLQHAIEEQGHADQIAERIVQLNGEPNFDPEGLSSRSHSEYDASASLEDMLREDLIAERVAIESYREMVKYFAEHDTTTKIMLEGILAKEEEHAEDISSMLEDVHQLMAAASRQSKPAKAKDDARH